MKTLKEKLSELVITPQRDIHLEPDVVEKIIDIFHHHISQMAEKKALMVTQIETEPVYKRTRKPYGGHWKSPLEQKIDRQVAALRRDMGKA